MRYLIGFILLASWNAKAEFPACPNNMVLAKDFIRAESRGWRLADIGNKCLKGQSFKFFKVAPMRTEELGPKLSDAIVIRKLEDSGEIVISRGGGDEIVV